MLEPIGPTQKKSMERLDHQLGDLIDQMQEGKQNFGLLFSIGQQLASLTESDDIPKDVKIKLNAALHNLQSDQISKLDIEKVKAAKQEIDEALEG